jgi:hypothetical protein
LRGAALGPRRIFADRRNPSGEAAATGKLAVKAPDAEKAAVVAHDLAPKIGIGNPGCLDLPPAVPAGL